MKRAIAVTITFIIEALFLTVLVGCRELKDIFYFSFYDISLIVIDYTHNDSGIPLLVVRLFHNKVIVTLVELIRHYFLFWDIRFLIPFLSPLGVFGLATGFWYLAQSKMRVIYKLGGLFFILAIPLIEMIVKPSLPFTFRVIFLSVPYVLLSLFGVWHFLAVKNKYRLLVFVLLLLVSLWWYLVFQADTFNVCAKP